MPPEPETLDPLAVFERERRRLFAIAYRMLGSVADAEDVLQDAWRRWSGVDHASVANPPAYLAQIVTRLSLDQLEAAHRRRIEYVGPWLPEPVVEPWGGERAPGLAPQVEQEALADSLSTAFLVLLERLAPVERAVFVLRECFDFSYRDIAQVVGKSEANCRQIDRRARQRLAEPRRTRRADPEEHARVVERFIRAVQEGDLDGLVAVLADDVRVETDGGGMVTAARRPVLGRSNVSRFLMGLRAKGAAGATFEPAFVNGRLGLLTRREGRTVSVTSFEVDAEGRITRIFSQLNPEKLRALT